MAFKYIAILVLLFASGAHAGEFWRSAGGEFKFENPKYKNSGAILEVRETGIFMSVYGPEWGAIAKTQGIRFVCNGARCEFRDNARADVTLVFQSNNTFVFNENSTSERMIRKGGGSGDSSGGGSSPWNFKEYADSNQVVYSAYQTDPSTGATLVVSCKAKSETLNWAIRLSEKTYLAAQGAILYAKYSLRGDAKVDAGVAQSSLWDAADNRYIVARQGAPMSLEDLKKGSQLNLSLIGMKPDGTEVKLESMKFSLMGSTAALNKLQSSCQNSTNDLPIPLP
jgi:hypothetical protein